MENTSTASPAQPVSETAPAPAAAVTDSNVTMTVSPENPHLDNPGRVQSSLNYAVELTYDGVGFMLPPHGSAKGLKKEKLGPLPPGVAFIAQ